MEKKRKCSKCNIKLDKDKYKNDRTVCKDCYNIKKRKYSNKTIIRNQQPKIENVNDNKNKTLNIGFSK